jgi:uncharacterized protein (DUF885 family)
MHRIAAVFCAALLISARSPGPRIETLPIPGPAKFQKVAKDVLDVAWTMDPSGAANAGLMDDAIAVPSYSPKSIQGLTARLDRDLATLRSLDWQSWSKAEQIDFRWIYATAETLRHQLSTERWFEHRPAQWLEPVAGVLVALASYAPDRPAIQDQVLAKVPGMLAEMRTVATNPTRRDLDTAIELVDALTAMARSRQATAAADALVAYGVELRGMKPETEFQVIGAESYAWRLKHALLLPWTPPELLAAAEADLAIVDARLAALPPEQPLPPPTEAQLTIARNLTRETQLGLYDTLSESLRAATIRGGWVTIPDAVGPLRARETPDAMIPLTGDGGSMNPPPTYASSNVGWWNVEHFHADTPEEERIQRVVSAQNFTLSRMGPYAAHEGFPGHHMQLAIARLLPDPLRSIVPDAVQNEGWGLYAEEALLAHGGFGDGVEAERHILRAYRHRIRRVIFDVKIETGVWTLQQAADFKYAAAPGEGKIDEDILRSINWPTQLVCYYAGKKQILAVREEYRQKMGAAYDERDFHDRFLAEGSIPIALIRAAMLDQPVPPIQ